MLKSAVRAWVHQRSLAVGAIFTLALGIGAATALFSAVNTVLLRPLPYPQADSIYTVRSYFPSGRFTIGLMATEEMDALAGIHGIEATAEAQRGDLTLDAGTGTKPVVAYGVSGNFFNLLGVPVAMGRALGTTDGTTNGSPMVVVLSHHIWTSMFGARPDVVGQAVRVAEQPARIVGVAPVSFDVPAGADIWVSAYFFPGIGHAYLGFARLHRGVSLASLQPQMQQAMDALGRKYPDQEDGRAYRLEPLLASTVGDFGPIVTILFAATGVLLLLAAVNVANLMLARSTGRMRDVAVRAALGASGTRILLELVTESFVLAVAAGVAGTSGAYALVRVLLHYGAAGLPRLDGLAFDGTVLAFAALVTIGTTLLIAAAPALQLAKSDIARSLGDTGRAVKGSRRTRRILRAFVVAEIAASVTLVAGAARLVAGYEHLRRADPGFDPRGRVVLDVLLPHRYENHRLASAWWHAVRERLVAAGAADVAAASSIPLRHEWDSTTFVDLVSRPDIPPAQRPNARMRIVTPDFFRTMGIRVIAGRPIEEGDDTADAPTVTVVNETFVRRYFPNSDPLREKVRGVKAVQQPDGKFVFVEVPIVGVVSDVKYASVASAPEPTVYLPMAQYGQARTFIVVRTAGGDAAHAMAALRTAVLASEPMATVQPGTMDQYVAASIERQRLGAALMSGFGIAALLLAMVGVFAVLADVVAQQSTEMALRHALGATRGGVFRLVLANFAGIVAGGLAAGSVLAWWTGALVTRYVFGVGAADPFVLGGSLIVVGLVAAVGTLVPARRAADLDPALVLRS